MEPGRRPLDHDLVVLLVTDPQGRLLGMLFRALAEQNPRRTGEKRLQ